MSFRWLRAHLRVLTTIWLSCQAVALSAFAPRNCCPAHSHSEETTAADEQDCHQLAADVDRCPIAGANGEACPMHRQALSALRASEPADCVMHGICDAPTAALASLIWVPGVLNEPMAQAPAAATPLSAVTAVLPLDLSFDLPLPPPRG